MPRLVRLPRDEPTVFSLVRRSFRGELEARLAESARRRSPYLGARFAVEISRSERQSHKVGDIARLHLLDDSGPVVFGRS